MGCGTWILGILAFVFFGYTSGTSTSVASIAESNISPVEFYADIPYSRTADGGFVLGNPDAPITIIQFGDFACPHCQDYYTTTRQLIENYVATGQAKFEYRMFISGADPVWGEYTAKLAECANDLRDGAFWPAHNILFELGRLARFNEQTASILAERLELNYGDLLDCAAEAEQVDIDVRLGTSLGVQSTPSIMVRFGDGSPHFITVDGQTHNRGPVSYEILEALILDNQGEEL